MLSFVIIIPIYNHKDTIEATVSQLIPYQLPIIIVDDGSDKKTKTILHTIAQQYSFVHLYTLPVNQGKGAAVMHGLSQADKLNFTHAIQIDADGQHNIKDVPQFIEQSTQHPEAVICAQPLYDASIPVGRKYGRKITHFFVAIETLTTHPLDTMCGFRCYPIKTTLTIIDAHPPGKRMNFDIEILVKMCWANIPAIRIPSKVIYPENGLSNFHYIKDNFSLIIMHSKLLLGMLIRLPQRRKKKVSHWSEIKEKGNVSLIQLLLWIYQFFGKNIFNLLLMPVMLYYYLSSHLARNSSKAYLQKIYQYGCTHPDFSKPPGWLHSYKHFLHFGFAISDKISAWLGDLQHSDIIFEKSEELLHLQRQGKGALILSAHLGNIEMARAIADKYIKMNALVFTKNAMKFNKVFQRVSPKVSQHLLHVDNIGLDTAVILKEKVDRGEFVIILADRTPISSPDRVNTCHFLGYPASFGQGAFILGNLLNCPVYTMFVLKEQKTYRIYLDLFTKRITLPRKQRQQALQKYIEKYAQQLEKYCLKAPYQWFNFFDFWQQKTETAKNKK